MSAQIQWVFDHGVSLRSPSVNDNISAYGMVNIDDKYLADGDNQLLSGQWRVQSSAEV